MDINGWTLHGHCWFVLQHSPPDLFFKQDICFIVTFTLTLSNADDMIVIQILTVDHLEVL